MYFFFWFFRRFDPELLYASEHYTKSCTCTVHTVFKSELIISPSYLSHLNKDFYFFHNILHVNLKLLVLDQFIKNRKKIKNEIRLHENFLFMKKGEYIL